MAGVRMLGFCFMVFFVTLFDRSWAGLWVKDIGVTYTNASIDYRRENCLPENVNKGFGGKFVWICPIFTNERNEAATSFNLIIQSHFLPYPDLAKGTDGYYRYLIPVHDALAKHKIENIWLSETAGGEGTSGNINEGRDGRRLFLNWHLDSDETTVTTQKTRITEDPLPEATQPRPSEEILEVVYEESTTQPSTQSVTLPTMCNCNCTEPSYQWTTIILGIVLCFVSFIFGRFLYLFRCNRNSQLDERSLFPSTK